MRTYDLTPLFRTSIGFDRMSRLMDAALKLEDSAKGIPRTTSPKRGEHDYRITLAVAGFDERDLDITAFENTLIIKGKSGVEEEGLRYLHRGIAGRSFERRFQRRPRKGSRRTFGKWTAEYRTGTRNPGGAQAPFDRHPNRDLGLD